MNAALTLDRSSLLEHRHDVALPRPCVAIGLTFDSPSAAWRFGSAILNFLNLAALDPAPALPD
ncbi:hypothetical protein [Sphingomonas vulcanisoli]|uniref:hypothetical protein n=1 Tax=Sphingomonas vulcanisoli TaxID=1658060 RepID=UPI00141D8CE3|nr:hypothetical protein [Sphingomonas vulcanisoli]